MTQAPSPDPNIDAAAVRQRMIDALVNELEWDPREAWEVAFHMTDWIADHYRLQKLMESPATLSDKEVKDVIYGYTFHAAHHINAAAFHIKEEPPQDVFGLWTHDNNETEHQ